MSLDLYGEEHQVVRYLMSRGLRDTEARIYTTILCRQYRAPKHELVSALRYHLPGIDSTIQPVEEDIRSAIDNLLRLNLLKIIKGLNEDPIEARSPWEKVLAEAFPNNAPPGREIAEIIEQSLKNFADFSPRERNLIERLGWATWETARNGFHEAISQAKQQIRLGVYSSITVYDEIKDEIRKALVTRQKMEVQILMFSPKLAAKMEGNPDLANDVKTRTKDWRQLYEEARVEARKLGHRPKLEIRHLQDEEMAAFHRVFLVDKRLWMLNVHRPGVERGIEGIVYRGRCEEKSTSNLFNMLDFYWRAAWRSGVDPSPLKNGLYQLRQHRHLLVILVLVVLAAYTRQREDWWGLKIDWWGGAFVGLIVGEIYNNLSSILNDLLQPIKWFGAMLQKLTAVKSEAK